MIFYFVRCACCVSKENKQTAIIIVIVIIIIIIIIVNLVRRQIIYLFIQQVVQCFHIFLPPFDNYIIFFLHLLLSFQSSSINPFSSISPLIPSAQVSLGLPRLRQIMYVYICQIRRGEALMS
jgi:hypothetical protein